MTKCDVGANCVTSWVEFCYFFVVVGYELSALLGTSPKKHILKHFVFFLVLLDGKSGRGATVNNDDVIVLLLVKVTVLSGLLLLTDVGEFKIDANSSSSVSFSS